MLALHDTVALPEPVRLDGVIALQVNPDGTVSMRLTIPANPLIEETVIVELAEVPIVKAVGEVADTAKSVTANVALAEWRSVRLAPVIVTE